MTGPSSDGNDRFFWKLVCLVRGHSEEYVGEYENDRGYAQCDAVCTRCDNTRLAWVGPKVSEIPNWEPYQSTTENNQ